MEDISNFSPAETNDDPSEVVVKKTKSNKKRKRDDTDLEDERESLKKQAKYYCSCAEQYATISRYSNAKLKEFIIHKQFEFDSRTKDSVFSFIHSSIATVLDTITQAEGHVANKIEQETQIRECLEMEGSYLIQYLNTKIRLLSLIVINTINGKKEHNATKPPIIEEISEDDIEKNGYGQQQTDDISETGQADLFSETERHNLSTTTTETE